MYDFSDNIRFVEIYSLWGNRNVRQPLNIRKHSIMLHHTANFQKIQENIWKLYLEA